MNLKNHLLHHFGLLKPESHCQTRINDNFGWIRPAAVVVFSIITLAINGQPMPDKSIPHHTKTDVKTCDNFIKIEGSTNVNHFHFEQTFNEKEKVIETHPGSGEIVKLKIPAHDFKASNPMMYDDFLELIKASEYPYIDITVFFENIKLPAGPENTVVPKIRIGLAGQSQTYQIPGQIHDCRQNSMHINGRININLKDFNLDPPTKFMGMVKVNNEVFINFGLTLNE
ncbi:YceI family protein [Marinilabilia sp.]|uniref:YceI family protein n=1 Tax=Marinilabilia sp. TaxID=2021252 RepID=UPI0025C0011D|nr:YceI family protein [Marinilabilia sp.]